MEEESVQSTHLEDFSTILDNSNPLPEVSETALQALSFIAGYAVHSTHTKLKDNCGDCFSSLTQPNYILLENQDNAHLLIQVTDRGGLKYPAMEVLEASLLLWKIYTAI